MEKKILIVDDEIDVRKTIETALKHENYMVTSVASGDAAIDMLEKEHFDLVITDMRMPGKDGVEVLRRTKQIDDTVEVIILTGYASIENAIETLRNDGAYDYLTKPLESIDVLLLSVAQALEHRTLRKMNNKLTFELQRQNQELQQVQAALVQSEERFRTIATITSDYFYSLSMAADGSFEVEWIDGAFEKITGYAREAIKTERDWSRLIHPEDQPVIDEAYRRILSNRRNISEYRFFTREGAERWIRDFSHPVWDPRKNRVTSVIGAVRDISERVRAETALHASEARYQSFMHQFNGIVFRCSLSEGVEFINGAVKHITGYEESDFVEGRIQLKQLVHPDDIATLTESGSRLRTVPRYATTREYRIVHRDGQVRWVKEFIQNVCDHTGSPAAVQAIVYDHTDRKAIEEKMQQDQIFKAIASLAGGVAHEFNNALVGITGNLELMVMEMDDQTPYATYLKAIKSSAQRMSVLTSQLLAYARGGRYHAQEVRIDEFLKNTLPLTMHAINPTVRLETDVPSQCACVNGDPFQLQMVLSAILANASEAMDDAGRIRLEVCNLLIDKQSKDVPTTLAQGDYVRLTVKDEGRGMDADTRKRVFEPFFTTKMHGRGLGMAAVYGIVKNHGGGITIDSEPSQGTTVSIYLPSMGVPETSDEKQAASADIVYGNSTILIVDDEPVVLDVGRLILEKLGYGVMACATGKEALDMLCSNATDISLVLLDIKLPDMSGADVLEVIKDRYPGLKVVICSGYAMVGSDRDSLTAAADDFIQKPFSMSELSTTIGRLLMK